MMGFFSTKSLARKHYEPLNPQCGSCGLHRLCKSPKLEPAGKGREGILIISETPGKEEDNEGQLLVGESSYKLERTFAKFGVDLYRDCLLTNSLICRPIGPDGDNRDPTDKEIEYCRPNLTKTLKEFNPKLIITLGNFALKALLSNIWKDDQGYGISRWAGMQIPCHKLNAWVCPTYHPAYLLWEPNRVVDLFFEQHLEAALQKTERPWQKVPDWEKKARVIIDDREAAESIMLMVETRPSTDWPIAFDFETTTKKPYIPGAEIFCCSLSDGIRAIGFPMHGKAIQAVKTFLTMDVPKVGYNLIFEHTWALEILGVRIRGWEWDGMNNSHILDCRPGISSLDFQAFTLLGIGKYGESISGYLVGNPINRIKQANRDEVLKYCAMDSFLEWHVADRQRERVGYGTYRSLLGD